MADDVKVKFGGDFSEIDKDAQSASKRIGTALGAWVGDYANSISGKLKNMFSLENIVGEFWKNFTSAFDKMFEIDNLSKKLGVSRKELQQFSKLGAEVGIDMETMGRSIAFANKTLGNLEKNQGARKTLMDFGYTTEQINSKNIQAIDLIYKLAESYEKNKKALGEVVATNELARQSTEFFGRAGQDLNPVIKMGNEALRERIRLMKIYSDEAVIGGAVTKRMTEIGQKKFAYHFGGKQAELYGQIATSSYVDDLEKEIKDEYKQKTGKNISQNELIKQMAMKAKFGEYQLTPEELGLIYNIIGQEKEVRNKLSLGMSEKPTHAYAMQEAFQNMAEQEKEKQKKNLEALPAEQTVLSASSLQQIGGGDVSSVLAGSTTSNIETYTRLTAENTAKIANEGMKPNTPTNQAK
jgi:hypothetical protein